MQSSAPQRSVREEAVYILRRVLEDEAYSNRLLHASHQHAHLDPRDQRLLTEIVYGVLRHLTYLDSHINDLAREGINSIEPVILTILRIAFYELLFLDRIPAHATLSEAVNIAKAERGKQTAGLVNAILRSAQREASNWLHPQQRIDVLPEARRPRLTALSRHYSHPRWLIDHYIQRLGIDATITRLEYHNQPAPLTLRVNPHQITRDAFLQEHLQGQASPTQYSPDGFRLQLNSALTPILQTHPHAIIVQDEPSQLIAHWLNPQPNEHILDACAAPGGKTTHIASLAPTASILATDRSTTKLQLVQDNQQRLQLTNIETLTHDATQPLPRKFHRILLDAPCSGLGTLRKHPELRYQRKKHHLAPLAQLQKQLLANLVTHLHPQGTLLYSVCTDTPQECEEIVEWFLHQFPQFQLHPLQPHEPGFTFLTPQGTLKTSPEQHQIDAFFAARFLHKP